MHTSKTQAAVAAVVSTALSIGTSFAALPPEKPMSTLEWELVGKDELYYYKALPSYKEAPFLTEMVNDGKLPPVKERLPEEPLVFATGTMVDGVGEYGGVFRHVIGGRPQGWNWMAGQHQGWGGINITIQECLVRKGPLWQVKSSEQDGPLPNLAKDWEWSSDRRTLTMHLIEGARWSDGDPFDTADIEFWWEDNVQDGQVPAFMDAGVMGEGTTLEIMGPYTFAFKFAEPQGPARVDSLAYIQGCPGPSHVLKPQHPKYSSNSYEQYINILPPEGDGGRIDLPVMGMFVPVLHRPDELVVLRRNPYYWKVDEQGQQLPYFNEMHFKLSTWSDRTTQAVAGTGDFSNMENPGNYVEALKQSQGADSPTKVNFGPRVLGWDIEINLSETVGTNNDVDREMRKFFRELDFRKAVSHAIDRNAVGQSIARGPFTHPWAGGITSGSPYYDLDAISFFGYNPSGAGALLDGLGLKDTDGNGVRNLPSGADLEIDLWYDTSEATDKKQADAVIAMMSDVGIRLIAKPVEDIDQVADSGSFNWMLRRNHWLVPTRETARHLPVSPTGPGMHLADSNGNRNLFPFEERMLEAYERFSSSWDQNEVAAAGSDILKEWTANVYTIGLVQAPAALLINKRIRNAHPGVPVFMFEWAEDSLLRERLWTPRSQQLDELLPGVAPHVNH